MVVHACIRRLIFPSLIHALLFFPFALMHSSFMRYIHPLLLRCILSIIYAPQSYTALDTLYLCGTLIIHSCVVLISHLCVALISHSCVALISHSCVALISHLCVAFFYHPCIIYTASWSLACFLLSSCIRSSF